MDSLFIGDKMYEYKKRSKIKKVLTLIILIIVVSASSIFIYSMYMEIDVTPYQSSGIENTYATRLLEETNEKENISNILTNITKCVVGVSKIKNTGEIVLETDGATKLGLGSGVVVSENGYIITNWHVAGGKYSNCYVTLENGNIVSGNVVWADSDLDLAIIKINVVGLQHINLGDSDNIELGETVYAIGNPIGAEFQRTVTSGIISGLDRTVRIEDEEEEIYMEDLIQTDASINSGNSGGPLVNSKGEVIGINSVKIETAEGIGFAIPVNIIKPIVESYITEDKFEEAYLGIFAYDTEVSRYLNTSEEFTNGICIIKISADGPAYNSGLRIGDIIIGIDNYSINRMSELRRYIYTKKVGDKVKLTISRNNKKYEVSIKLGKK